MMTIDDEKRNLYENICEMKDGSIEQMCLITMYSLGSYFKSLFTFGSSNKVTRDNLNIIKEMFKIIKTERTLLNYILQNFDKFDIAATQEVVEMLDDVNDKTVLYYYDVINGIEDAAELKEEHRGYRPRCGFPTLIEDSSYAEEVIALGENLESLKSFLDFEEEFWEFIKDKTKKVDTSIEIMEKMVYAIPIYNEEGYVVSLQLMIPRISNLESALLAIKIYKKAYDIYKMIGKKYDKDNLDDSAILQERYKNNYLPRKVKNLLGLKSVK